MPVALASHDSITLPEPWLNTSHPAWSDQELRWVCMTFPRYQAWLARPDLDPAEFASDDVMSCEPVLREEGLTGIN
jgi:hypothetical protein